MNTIVIPWVCAFVGVRKYGFLQKRKTVGF